MFGIRNTDFDLADDFLDDAFNIPSSNHLKTNYEQPNVKRNTVIDNSHFDFCESLLAKMPPDTVRSTSIRGTDYNWTKNGYLNAFSENKLLSTDRTKPFAQNSYVGGITNKCNSGDISFMSSKEIDSSPSLRKPAVNSEQCPVPEVFSDDTDELFQMNFKDDKGEVDVFHHTLDISSLSSHSPVSVSRHSDNKVKNFKENYNLNTKNTSSSKCSLLGINKPFEKVEENNKMESSFSIYNQIPVNNISHESSLHKDRMCSEENPVSFQFGCFINANKHNSSLSNGKLAFTEPVSTNKVKSLKRKFPGPAGILPFLPQEQDNCQLNQPCTSGSSSEDRKSSVFLSSQSSEDEFKNVPWKILMQDLDIDDNDPNCILANCNIRWVLQQAASKQLPRGKVPILCVLIKNITVKGAEASAILKDKTGEIKATVHRKLLEEYHNSLEPGAALVLKQVSVFSPKIHCHYLNLTPNNFVCVYDKNGLCVHSEAQLATIKRNFSSDIIKLNSMKQLHNGMQLYNRNLPPCNTSVPDTKYYKNKFPVEKGFSHNALPNTNSNKACNNFSIKDPHLSIKNDNSTGEDSKVTNISASEDFHNFEDLLQED